MNKIVWEDVRSGMLELPTAGLKPGLGRGQLKHAATHAGTYAQIILFNSIIVSAYP